MFRIVAVACCVCVLSVFSMCCLSLFVYFRVVCSVMLFLPVIALLLIQCVLFCVVDLMLVPIC